MRFPGGKRIKDWKPGLGAASAVVLFFWGIAGLSLISGVEAAGNIAYAAAAIFAGAMLVWVALRTAGIERFFWVLLAAGLLLEIPASLGLIPPFSYAPLFGALLLLVHRTTSSIFSTVVVEGIGVMFSAGLLLVYFLPAGSETGLLAIAGPVCGAGLLYLTLVTISTGEGPPFAGLLAGGFAILVAGDVLGLLGTEPFGAELAWALGFGFLGLAAAKGRVAFASGPVIQPWNVFAFWFGPLSPAVLYGFLLAWSVSHPPVPPYVLWGGVGMMAVLALRISVVSYASRALRLEAQRLSVRLEQERISEELHYTVERSVSNLVLLSDACRNALEKGDEEEAERLLPRLREASEEARREASMPVEELAAGRLVMDPDRLLSRLLREEAEHFPVTGFHSDLSARLDGLSPEELSAAYRITAEALRNAAEHSGARNVLLQSRKVGSTVLIKVRDDGEGFDPPSAAEVGISLMRKRADSAGAKLDMISKPGRGTTVQVRFEKG